MVARSNIVAVMDEWIKVYLIYKANQFTLYSYSPANVKAGHRVHDSHQLMKSGKVMASIHLLLANL